MVKYELVNDEAVPVDGEPPVAVHANVHASDCITLDGEVIV